MLAKIFAGGATREVVAIIDVVVGIAWVPVRIAHGIFVGKILLWSPHLFRAVRILGRWEGALVLRNVNLIVSHEVVETRVLLILEPGVRNSKIVIRMDTDGQLTWNRIPGILVHLPDRGITVCHLSHLIIGTSGPQNFNLLAFGVCDDLSADVGLICLIEDINAEIDNKVGVIDFLIRSQTELLDTQCLTTGQAWHTTHDLLNIS